MKLRTTGPRTQSDGYYIEEFVDKDGDFVINAIEFDGEIGRCVGVGSSRQGPDVYEKSTDNPREQVIRMLREHGHEVEEN